MAKFKPNDPVTLKLNSNYFEMIKIDQMNYKMLHFKNNFQSLLGVVTKVLTPESGPGYEIKIALKGNSILVYTESNLSYYHSINVS